MKGRAVEQHDLTAQQRRAMLELLSAHFHGISKEQFHADLNEKNWAVLVEDEAGRLVGFTTLLFYQSFHRDRRVNVVCSGDTIVDPAARGSSALLRTWIRTVENLRQLSGDLPTNWLLIVSGFRTYRFLPVCWRQFYPRHDQPTPPPVQALVDHLAAERFGQQYDPVSGIVRLGRPQVLREPLKEIPISRQNDPHIVFFDQCNPGHVRGDELVCITDLSPENLTPIGRRVLSGSRQPECVST